ncbi:MAG: FAD:protein FMN transferase [Bacteroides sp.]|nr:FAD:protein FMN transferase [Bacteroides sp.]
MKPRQTIYTLTIIVALALTLAGCNRSESYLTCEGGVWNTTYRITYMADRDLRDTILNAMKSVELSLSPFAEGSLISAVNRGDTSARADRHLRHVFEASLEINRLSHGAFDPTVAPLINLWGFGYRSGSGDPSAESIDSLLSTVGIGECSLDNQGRIIRKSDQTEFNFSAITKGYGCDMVGEALRRNGVENYLVEIGGEIAASGKSPRGKAWRIMIDAPVENDSTIVHSSMAVIGITDCGVATSGNYRNYRQTVAGKVWHTISPVTGRPAPTDLLSATVIAPSCMMADALATSCMAMSAREALSMISSIPEVQALLVTADTTLVTPGFPIAK